MCSPFAMHVQRTVMTARRYNPRGEQQYPMVSQCIHTKSPFTSLISRCSGLPSIFLNYLKWQVEEELCIQFRWWRTLEVQWATGLDGRSWYTRSLPDQPAKVLVIGAGTTHYPLQAMHKHQRMAWEVHSINLSKSTDIERIQQLRMMTFHNRLIIMITCSFYLISYYDNVLT